MKEHECKEFQEAMDNKENGSPAINEIQNRDGYWFAVAEDPYYVTPINYCPFCGEKLRKDWG